MVGQAPTVNVPGRVGHLRRRLLRRHAVDIGDVLVHRARDDVEKQPLGALRLVVHELLQRFPRSVTQPVVHRQAVALGLAYFLAVGVEEQFVGETLRRGGTQDAADAAGQPDAVDEVLAGHFVVHVQGVPAHRPVGLPLHLAVTASHRCLESFMRVRVAPNHCPGRCVQFLHGHLHDHPRLGVHREKRRIGRATIRPQGRQDHGQHLRVAFQHASCRRVETAGGIVLGGRGEFVFEPEAVQERPKARVVVRAKTVMGAEGVGNAGQRLAEVFRQHILVRHIVRDFAQSVHVVAERQQLRRLAC